MENGRHKLFNFQISKLENKIINEKLEEVLNEKLEEVLNKLDSAAKFKNAPRFVLRGVKTGEYWYYSVHTKTILF